MDTEYYRIILDTSEIKQICALAQELNRCPHNECEEFARQAKELSTRLPERIIQILDSFSLKGSSTGYLLFSEFLVDDKLLPDTPKDNLQHLGEKTVLSKIQAIMNQRLGEMVAYEAEGNGRLFQDMTPNYKFSATQTSLGSGVELEIHTEQAFSKMRPDMLSLACLRGDKNANTFILHVSKILENFSLYEQELLHKPLWKIGVDMSFKMHGKEFIEGTLRGPIPILTREGHLIFDQDLMRGINEESEQLRQKIIQIYYKEKLSHCLEPGEIIIVDNRYAVHGRSAFTPKFDGRDRFIIRSFVTLDLDRSAHARPNDGRMIDAMYS